MCHDHKRHWGSPRDDYSNIETLQERGIIDRSIAEKLIEANSLRNWIIHRYNRLDDKIVYERMLNLLEVFEKFVEDVKKWLEKNF